MTDCDAYMSTKEAHPHCRFDSADCFVLPNVLLKLGLSGKNIFYNTKIRPCSMNYTKILNKTIK